ncbi:MAG: peroxidase [Actinobacteria bacterium]|nr:peroxidase [Actinomycetota bacterium]MCI0543740.1 peroxidase [Actinomycetota bacterium]MCI0679510.1 peroxidase [Actinomycetota bacterium]
MDRFADDWGTAGLDAPTMALLAHAEKLTREPWTVDTADIETLRGHGFDDRGISSLTQVVAYFNYINRVADGLGVGAEDWLGPDGTPT